MLTAKLLQIAGPSRLHRYRRSQRASDRRRPAPEGLTPLHRFQRALGLRPPIPAGLRLPIPAGLGSPIPASLKPPIPAGVRPPVTARLTLPIPAGLWPPIPAGLWPPVPADFGPPRRFLQSEHLTYLTNNFCLVCPCSFVYWVESIVTGKMKRRNFKPVLIFVEEWDWVGISSVSAIN